MSCSLVKILLYEVIRNVFWTGVRFPPAPPKVIITLRTDWYKFDHLIPVEITSDGADRFRQGKE